MIKTSLLTLVLTSVSLAANAQEQSVRQATVQSNGVVAHEAAGVEGFTSSTNQQQESGKPIAEWNLAECIDASRIITKKLEKATAEVNAQEIERYQAVLAEIEWRRKQLIQSGN